MTTPPMDLLELGSLIELSLEDKGILIRHIRSLRSKLTIATEALESISKNSCCDTCQEAKLVSLKALSQIKWDAL